jgi:phosphoadenosine phosphosulfate reductase
MSMTAEQLEATALFAGMDVDRLARLQDAPPEEVLQWAIETYFPDISVACSMQDAVVVDLAWKIEPRVEVFFLETNFHFPETLATAERLRERYSLNLIALQPIDNPRVFHQDGFAACCADRKVSPMNNYLLNKRAWVSGLRRADGPSRADAQAVEWEEKRSLVKVNPIVAWSDEQVQGYIADNKLIVNKLHFKGYESIGCHPCTVPGTGREGRWAGSPKVECGLHVQPVPADWLHQVDRVAAPDTGKPQG